MKMHCNMATITITQMKMNADYVLENMLFFCTEWNYDDVTSIHATPKQNQFSK